MRKLYFAAALLVLVGCATVVRERFEDIYGKPDPARFDVPVAPAGAISYRRDVQPILDRRCVVCHACYDANCQLKLGAFEGVARGASRELVYDGGRILEAQPSRLFIDADRPSEWRKRGFFPVLNEYTPDPAAMQQASLLARVIALKARHPVTPNALASPDLDFSVDRAQQCTPVEAYDAYEKRNPQWGMPFGLPGLSKSESDTINGWLLQGSPYEGPEQPNPGTLKKIAQWERFLNGDSLRAQLINRYIYEHLFLAHVYFDDEPNRQYLRLVRSSTPPGEPVREIASRRPFDDPGVARVYYRFRLEGESIVAKTHMPYALGATRMARWTALFHGNDYNVKRLPGYGPDVASNPFDAFRELPAQARYRFMLDEAQFTVMGFIKGPVCRGQTALNVINDHFWVFFQDPDAMTEDVAAFLNRESRNLSLPAQQESDALILTPALRYARQEASYLEAKSAAMEQALDKPEKVSLKLVWDGNGRNPNAALTIYRHFDNASVLKGLVGETPKTAWILGYALLERIHYLLVAGYDVYGNVGHQVNTRLYMDFLRMEGEFNFITLLPQASRLAVRDHWYRGASDDVKERVYGKVAHFNRETGIRFPESAPPDKALMAMLKTHVSRVAPADFDIGQIEDADLKRELQTLAGVRGTPLSWMPEASLLRIEESGKPSRNFTLLRNTAHLNVTFLLREGKALVPAEDTLDVLNGFATAYPNAFYRIERRDLPAFTEQVRKLASEENYQALSARFGVRRTSPSFWALSDTLHADYARSAPIEAGLFDYGRLENR